MIDNSKKEQISFQVIRTLVSRFLSFPLDATNIRNAPFHEAFLNAFSDKLQDKVGDIPFFISLSSWLHGLNTTLGQSFFENVAHILADGGKKPFTAKRDTLLTVTKRQKNIIADIITDLKNDDAAPSRIEEEARLFSTIDDSDEIIDANSFTVDVYVEERDKIICVEMKTVKPNAGEMRGEKQKILEAKAALYCSNRHETIEYYIGFPFDPTSDTPTDSDLNRFLSSIIDGTKYFEPEEEVLLADDLWNFLSGRTDTMKQLLEIINSIAKTDFLNRYNFLNNRINLIEDKKTYVRFLSDWNLFSELSLIQNDNKLREIVKKDIKLTRLYNQPIFKTTKEKEGDYNIERFITLSQAIRS